MLSNNMSLVRTCVASAAEQHVTKCATPLLLASRWSSLVLSHTHHSLWIHQQQVFGQATVHPGQHVLARVSGALPDQEVSVSDQESFCVPSAHAAVIPRLSTELVLVWCYRGSAARRTGPLVLQDLGDPSCSSGRGPGSSGTCLVKLQCILEGPLIEKIHVCLLLSICQILPCRLCRLTHVKDIL